MNCGDVGRGGNSDSNADRWGDWFAVSIPANGAPGPTLLGGGAVPEGQLAKGGGKDVGGAGHDGPIGLFVGASDCDGSNGGGNPKRSAREIIVSPVRERRSRATNEKRPLARPFSSPGGVMWRVYVGIVLRLDRSRACCSNSLCTEAEAKTAGTAVLRAQIEETRISAIAQ
jgi:hypothetical protein